MNRSNKYNQTPLYWACINNNLLMCELLMMNQSNPNIISCDQYQYTTMLKASFSGNLSTIKCLLNENESYKFTFDWVCVLFLCCFVCECIKICFSQIIIVFVFVIYYEFAIATYWVVCIACMIFLIDVCFF